MAKKQENEAARDFPISIPSTLAKKLGLDSEQEYEIELLLLRNKTVNLRFLRKGKQDGATQGEDK